jgi:hypothetical protein
MIMTTLHRAAWEATIDVLGNYLDNNPSATDAKHVRDAYDALSLSDSITVEDCEEEEPNQ